MIAVHKLENW